MAIEYNFKFMPLVGKLSGKSMAEQTETAINEIAKIVNDNTSQAKIINTLAEEANANSVEALEKANEALETSSRVYIKETGAVDLDSYCESQLIYINNIFSQNLPVESKGFLEVKTNDDKTQATQVFIDDTNKEVYTRSGAITETTVGDVTTYTASYSAWNKAASTNYVENMVLIRQNSTAYSVGDIARSTALASYMLLECTSAGTTGASEPSFAGVDVGDVVSDGSLSWTIIKFASTDYVREEIRQHANMPVGYEYFTFNPNIPQGSLPLFGGEYSRETYADLWAWVQTQTGYLKTEAQWQALSSANAGNVPYYSDGDGSTTFRVPSLKCWVKGANGTVSEVGSYLAAGLPNITGGLTFRSVDSGSSYYNIMTSRSGAFSDDGVSGETFSTAKGTNNRVPTRVKFDASASNSIYGNSTTVQPESIVGLWLVKAYGVVEDTGTIDEQQYIDDRYAAMKTYVDGKFESIVASGTGYIRYESGLQICWGSCAGSGNSDGTAVIFPVAFNSAPIVTATANVLTENPYPVSVQVSVSRATDCYITVSVNATWTSAAVAARWIAIGYWK